MRPCTLPTPADVARALAGEPRLHRLLVDEVRRVVGRRVRRLLFVRRGTAGLAMVDDLTQEVLVELFDRDARRLRAWDPARGANLCTFVDRVTTHLVLSWLRSPRRSAGPESACAPEDFGALACASPGPERDVGARELVDRVLGAVNRSLDARDADLFQALVVDEDDIEALSGTHGLSAGALYVRRCRMRKLAREIAVGACRAELALAA